MNPKLPWEIIRYIDSFICSRDTAHGGLCNIYNMRSKCEIIKYKSLVCCEFHGNSDVKNSIHVLKNMLKLRPRPNKKHIWVHFNSQQALRYAQSYLVDFGIIMGTCCNNTGARLLYCPRGSHYGSNYYLNRENRNIYGCLYGNTHEYRDVDLEDISSQSSNDDSDSD